MTLPADTDGRDLHRRHLGGHIYIHNGEDSSLVREYGGLIQPKRG